MACAPRQPARTSNRENRGHYFCGVVNAVHGGRLDRHLDLQRDRQAGIQRVARRLQQPPARHRPVPQPRAALTEEDPAEDVFLWARGRDPLSREVPLPGAHRR